MIAMFSSIRSVDLSWFFFQIRLIIYSALLIIVNPVFSHQEFSTAIISDRSNPSNGLSDRNASYANFANKTHLNVNLSTVHTPGIISSTNSSIDANQTFTTSSEEQIDLLHLQNTIQNSNTQLNSSSDTNYVQQNTSACQSDQAILHLPPKRHVCLIGNRQWNESCIIDSQCSAVGLQCSRSPHLPGSSPLLQFVAIFTLKARMQLANLSLDSENELEPNHSPLPTSLDTLYNRLVLSANDTRQWPGSCNCASGHVLQYTLRADSPDGTASRQLHALLSGALSVQGSSRNRTDSPSLGYEWLRALSGGPMNALRAHCVRARRLGETCTTHAQCTYYDLNTSCRRSRCTCLSGYAPLLLPNKRPTNVESTDTVSSTGGLLDRLLRIATEETDNNRRGQLSMNTRARRSVSMARTRCVQRFNALGAWGGLAGTADQSASLVQQATGNVINKRNCTAAEIFCAKAGRCERKHLKRHLQQNLVSIVWTMLCLLSVLLVLGSLLMRNRPTTPRASHNDLSADRAASNNSLASVSLWGALMGRGGRSDAARTAQQQQQLLGCTPPPNFAEIMDRPPSYEEAVKMLEKTEQGTSQSDIC